MTKRIDFLRSNKSKYGWEVKFDKGDFIDVVYQIQRNCFNGNTTPQMILSETETVKK